MDAARHLAGTAHSADDSLIPVNVFALEAALQYFIHTLLNQHQVVEWSRY